MTWAYLNWTQPKARAETALKLKGAFIKLPEAIDALLRLPCLLSLPQDDTGYSDFAQSSLIGIGHTAGATYDLWSKAFYPEAAIQVRHMLEVLVQIRYFERHRAKYMPHFRALAERTGLPIEPGALKEEVRFRPMFDDVAPGLYRPHYAILSSIAHGGLGGRALRSNLNKLAKTSEPVFGCVYNEQRAGLVLAYFQIALHGLINIGLELDPESKGRDNGAHRAVIDGALDFSRRSLDEDWRSPGNRPLLKSVAGLISWTPPTE